jgi:hypothetical protein
VSFESLLEKKSGGKFKSFSDIERALEEAPEQAFANEMVAKLNEYVKNGGSANDFLKTQTVNFGEMNDLDALREHAALFDSTLSREEIDLLIEDEYGLRPDASDTEKRLAAIKMKKAGQVARRELQDYQKKWAVPQSTSEEVQQAARAAAEKWQQELSGVVDLQQELAIKIGEEDFKFVPSSEAKEAVKKGHDLNKFWDRYKDGSERGYDLNKFVKDMFILNNFDDIIKSVAVFAKGQGADGLVDSMKNANFKPADHKDGKGGTKSIEDQIGQQMFL